MSIEVLQSQATELAEAAVKQIKAAKSTQELQQIRVQYTGKKGELTAISKEMRNLTNEEKPLLGKAIFRFP